MVLAVMTVNHKRNIGVTLHAVATAFYMLAIMMGIMLILEIWKGYEILFYFDNNSIAFGGARETLVTGLAFTVCGLVVNFISRRVYPRLHGGPWSVNADR